MCTRGTQVSYNIEKYTTISGLLKWKYKFQDLNFLSIILIILYDIA